MKVSLGHFDFEVSIWTDWVVVGLKKIKTDQKKDKVSRGGSMDL